MSQLSPSIKRLADLQQLIADFSKIDRVVQFADTGRMENDAEHSYGLAMTCWFLAPKIAPNLDLAKILMYALAHDMVEVHSGDTFIYDESAVKTKPAREAAAIPKLAEDWPDFPEMNDYVKGYADKRDAEARFAYAVDKMLPPLLIMLGETAGSDKQTFWQQLKVTHQMLADNKIEKIQLSAEVAPYGQALIDWLEQFDYFYQPPADA